MSCCGHAQSPDGMSNLEAVLEELLDHSDLDALVEELLGQRDLESLRQEY
jgi:hypothetical protein